MVATCGCRSMPFLAGFSGQTLTCLFCCLLFHGGTATTFHALLRFDHSYLVQAESLGIVVALRASASTPLWNLFAVSASYILYFVASGHYACSVSALEPEMFRWREIIWL